VAGVFGGSAYASGEPGRTRRRGPGGAAHGGHGTAGAPRGEVARAGMGAGADVVKGPNMARGGSE